MQHSFKLFVLLFLVVLYSCNSNQNLKESEVSLSSPPAISSETNSKTNIQSSLRKIIKNGEIVFETDEVLKTEKSISEIVKVYKGYITEMKVSNYDDKIEHRVIVKVPSQNFDILVNKVTSIAQKVISKDVNASDVTEEFIDIETRLKTKKALENRYIQLLKQANKVSEIIAIEKEIGNLRSEIEPIEGRLKYLSDQVSLSTLTIVYSQEAKQSFGFGSKFKSAIHNGWENFMLLIMALVNLWPLLLIGVLIFAIFKYLKIKRS